MQKELLEAEFPNLEFLALRGYRIRYSRTRAGMPWRMFLQAGKIRHAIRYEQFWLKEMIGKERLDAVISDNRYGLYSSSIPSFFITHQLNILTGKKWTDRIVRKMNFRYIERFDQCWVPDLQNDPGIAGKLSHPPQLPATPLRYIGPLSRFTKNGVAEKKGSILIILSGPEPQRTFLEEVIIEQASRYNGFINIVRGLPGHGTIIPSSNMIRCFNHLATDQLNNLMEEAEFIISRSGYSTIIDCMKLGKKCIFIPTPGQTEQEYLASSLMKRRIAYSCSQKNFDLGNCLKQAGAFDYHLAEITNESLEESIRDLLTLI
jgi:UDP-N-acetylglucosamine transferase subunit ALG13